MPDALAPLLSRAATWFDRAAAAGWIDAANRARLDAVEHATPADLFHEPGSRPLVVAFFGGTGVGKSSLLNRVAGQALARTGVERPTSREVTVYLHEAVRLAELPTHLPVERTQVVRHSAARWRDVAWLDAPDVDSVEQDNRALALAWLAHVDLVCYVVSPERYRDDAGWRVLRRRQHRHGWLFVMNRSDEGDPTQADDFARILREAGFERPALVSTCCVEPAPDSARDEFNRLVETVDALRSARGVEALERVGLRARLADLHAALRAAMLPLGGDADWQRLDIAAARAAGQAVETILAGTEYALRGVAARFATGDSGPLARLSKTIGGLRTAAPADAPTGHPAVVDAALVGELWDDWSQAKVAACADAIEIETRKLGLAAAPVRRAIEQHAGRVGDEVRSAVHDGLRAALARPGTALTRGLRRVTGFLMAFLPALALLWVAYAAVRGFYAAAHGGAAFLGGAFAVHSVLLVVIAWAVPWLTDRLLRPSLEAAALRGLRGGLRVGLDGARDALLAGVAGARAEAAELRRECERLAADVSAAREAPPALDVAPFVAPASTAAAH
ncbi:MAG: GTPase domain-containing protein [Phycisphaerales bacterium]|nr:GTPase domain-containing protein [Phycisphaerales bacterium]